MAKGFIGASGCKAYLGAVKMRTGYIGATRVYSAGGNTVIYLVDTGVTYQEEVAEDASCLSPKTFTPSKRGWEFVGWRSNSVANGSVLSSKVMSDDIVTLYAVFRQAVTVTYYNNSTTASSTSGYRYYNNGNVVNPSFTLTQVTMSGWTARGWSTSTAGNGGITYNNGTAFTRDSNITLYGMYQQSITVTYYNNSTTAATTSGIRYYNSNDNTVNPSFTLTQTAKSGWTARGWSTGTAGNSGITYNNGATFTRDSNTTLYGMYQQTITVTYYNNSTSASTSTGTRYYNSSGNTVNPSFTLSQASKSGWTARGWTISASGEGVINYTNGATFTRDSNITLYGTYYQTITLSYNGNSSTGGSTDAQTGTRYYNSNGSTVNPSFTLSANGFSKDGNIFSKWALGSASGTQYAPGDSVTLSANTTMYAVWTGAAHYFTPLNSVTWTKTSDAWSWNNLIATDSSIKVQTKKSEDTGNWGNIKASATVPTGGCTKVRLKISTSQYGLGRITVEGNSVDIPANTAATDYYFDVSGSTVSITIEATDGTAYFIATTTLTEIYFYN